MDINKVETEQQLRSHITETDFLTTIKKQMNNGYRTARVSENEEVVCVVGFRVGKNLAWGKHLYLDDLVSGQRRRSQGAG